MFAAEGHDGKNNGKRLGLPQDRRDTRLTLRRPVPAGHRQGLRRPRVVKQPYGGSAIHAQRPVILNGIEEFVGRGDLSDRCVFLNLPSIAPSKRRREDEFWDAFNSSEKNAVTRKYN